MPATIAKDYPVAAVDYLRQHPHPKGMFNDYFYGGYLIWRLGPQHKVFIDGRGDLYEYSRGYRLRGHFPSEEECAVFAEQIWHSILSDGPQGPSGDTIGGVSGLETRLRG